MIPYTERLVTIDATFRCPLECPKCFRQTLRNKNIPIPGNDMTVEQFNKLVNYFARIDLCGQISDPIFNPNFIDFLKICKEKNKKISIHTAASQKPESWWKQAFKSNLDAHWIFGIDGLPHESFLYRINQDGEKLFKMMQLAKKCGVKYVIWQYIIFSYNENHIEEASKLAKDNDIIFELNYSGRWQKENEHDIYKPIDPSKRLISKHDR